MSSPSPSLSPSPSPSPTPNGTTCLEVDPTCSSHGLCVPPGICICHDAWNADDLCGTPLSEAYGGADTVIYSLCVALTLILIPPFCYELYMDIKKSKHSGFKAYYKSKALTGKLFVILFLVGRLIAFTLSLYQAATHIVLPAAAISVPTSVAGIFIEFGITQTTCYWLIMIVKALRLGETPKYMKVYRIVVYCAFVLFCVGFVPGIILAMQGIYPAEMYHMINVCSCIYMAVIIGGTVTLTIKVAKLLETTDKNSKMIQLLKRKMFWIHAANVELLLFNLVLISMSIWRDNTSLLIQNGLLGFCTVLIGFLFLMLLQNHLFGTEKALFSKTVSVNTASKFRTNTSNSSSLPDEGISKIKTASATGTTLRQSTESDLSHIQSVGSISPLAHRSDSISASTSGGTGSPAADSLSASASSFSATSDSYSSDSVSTSASASASAVASASSSEVSSSSGSGSYSSASDSR